MKDTKQIGDISVAMVVAALLKQGKSILTPFGDRHPYDVAIDEGNVFKRIQCKTGRLKNGVIVFNAYSVVRDTKAGKWVHRAYGDSVDAYGVYSPDLGQSFLVPRDVVRAGEGRLLVAGMGSRRCEMRDAKLPRSAAYLIGDVPER